MRANSTYNLRNFVLLSHLWEGAVHVALNSQSNTTNSSSPAEGQTVFKTFKHFVMNLPATAIEFLGNVFGRLRAIDFDCIN